MPAPTTNTFYMFYFPAGTTIISDGALAHGLTWDAIEETKDLGKGDNVLTVSASGNTIAVGGGGTVTVTMKSKPTGMFAVVLVRSQQLDSKSQPTGQIHYWPIIVFPK